MTDWIQHDGGPPPELPVDTLVEIRLRESGPITAFGRGRIDEWDWWHDEGDPDHDIVAYRVVPHE